MTARSLRRARRPWCRAAALALVAAAALPGCTVLSIQAGDGEVTVQRRAGLLVVQPQPGRAPMVLHSTALGWQAGPAGQGLGFVSSRLVMMPEGCRVIVMTQPGQAWTAAELKALAERQLCVVSAAAEAAVDTAAPHREGGNR